MIKSNRVWELISEFINVIEKETGFPVLIYGTDGHIIRATDTSRIGDLHTGALRIMQGEVEAYAVTEAEARENCLVREGYSFPIKIDGKIVAGFGITGKLEFARPLAKIAVKMITAMIAEQNSIDRLVRSEKKYRYIFDQSLNGIFQTSKQGRVLTANAALAEILGYPSPEDMISQINDLGRQLYVEPQARVEFLEALKREGCLNDFVTRFRRLDGKIIDVSINARWLRDTDSGQPYVEGFLVDITARKRAEEQLRLSENNLRITLDSISDGVISTDLDGRIVRINPMACQLTGWSKEEALGRQIEEVYHLLDATTGGRNPEPSAATLTLGKMKALINHTILVARNGIQYQIAHSGAPIRDTDGNSIGVVLVFRDITESYEQARKIRLSEQKLKHITANIPGVVCRLKGTEKGTFILDYASEKLAHYFGIAPDSHKRSIEFLSGIPDDEKKIFLASINDAATACGPWKYEGRFLTPDGKPIWFSGNAAPQREEGGLAYYGVLMDISERKAWENALTTSEQRFRDMFNEAPVMYVITEKRDDEWYILEANNTFLELLGYRQEEVVDTPLQGYFSIESKQEFFSNGSYANDMIGPSTTRECSLIAKNGNPVYSLFRALPEKDANGAEWGARSMFLDITARKTAENNAKRLQIALAQAQKMEAIGSLAGGISHDFNNILSAVIGFSQLSLMELEKEHRIRANIEKILKAGMRAKDLVSQILTFSRQEKLEVMPLQVGPLLRESLKLLRSTIPVNIHIVSEIERPIDNVMADPVQIQQIIMNLCTNAAHAMEEKGGTLTVSLSRAQPGKVDAESDPDSGGDKYIRIGIKDTGCGIARENIDRIFDPYFTTKEKGKGTGMGLSMVHGIVKDYGGTIEVKSCPAGGTEFCIYIPAILMKEREIPQVSQKIPRGNEGIMLVDDELDILEFGQRLLEGLGYRISIFSDGDAAQLFLKRNPDSCDLLITDFMMPKISGIDLCEKMRKIKPELKVIIWTGYGAVLQKLRESGIHGALQKPIMAEELACKVREVLDKG